MPKPHPFAAAPATKGQARAVSKPSVTVYGYARVSTGGQSVDAQARQLRAAGGEFGDEPGKLRPVGLGSACHLAEHLARAGRDEGQSVREIARSYNVSASTMSRLTA
jgi:hypothetical protein